MTVKEILELPKEEQFKYITQHKVSKAHNIYELCDFLQELATFNSVMSSVQQDKRSIGWYEGQSSAYQQMIEILQDLGLKKE